MTDEWVHRVYETASGVLQATVVCGSSDWATRMTGQGFGDFDIQAYESGISRADLEELTRSNAYTITQEWAPTDHVVFAGVIQADEWDDTKNVTSVSAVELRGAYFNSRMLWSLPAYNDPLFGNLGDTPVLTVTGRSRAGAVRAVLAQSYLSDDPASSFPLDLPADGAGGFSAVWKYNERLFVEDHLTQIEEHGCETYLRPYRDGDGNLRYEVLVQDGQLKYGTETVFPIRGSESPVRGLRVRRDGVNQMTGVAVFGEGGKSALMRHAPFPVPLSFDIPVRDVWIDRGDLDTGSRLQSVADHRYAVLKHPSRAWRFDLNIYPDGPEYAGVGRALGPTVASGHPRLSAGVHHKRVIALRGDMGMFVTPEVEDAA